MNVASPSLPGASPRLITWAQNAAIFACCANFFSTALTSLGFAVFLALFLCICITKERRHLATANFPLPVAIAIGLYIGWQIIGLVYTDAPMAYAVKSVYSERKILYILPLILVFADEAPKRRFLIAFLLASVIGLVMSFLVIDPFLHWRFTLNPDNVFRSNVTQSMIFALGGFLSLWFATQYQEVARKMVFYVVALAFFLNIATLTAGRSGYVVCLVLVVWSFAMWRGFKGVLVGLLAALFIGALAFTASTSVHNRVMKGVNEINTYSTSAEESSLGIRMVLYKTTWTIIQENPLFGTGTGGFKKRFSTIAAEKYSGWQASPAEDPHNQYLFVTVENGLIGLATFLLLLFTLVKYCLKDGSPYGKMAAGCVLAWSVTSLFSGHFRTFPEGHLIAAIVGILMVSRVPKGT
jgi:O-antigen ligase